MATARQIAANRRNAKKSTGPRSAEGRARSARNATRHGLNAAVPVDEAVIGLFRALVGDPAADPAADPGSAAFDHAALELARTQVRLAEATRHLAEVDAKISEMVAAGGFAGTTLSRSWKALMDDAGITAAFIAEANVTAFLEEKLPPGVSRRSPGRQRRLDALLEELEQTPDRRPTGAQVMQDKGLYRLLMGRSLLKMDPVRIVLKERQRARRYMAEARAARRKALQRWLDQREAAEGAAIGALPAAPGPEA
jgi:hypothetical protein